MGEDSGRSGTFKSENLPLGMDFTDWSKSYLGDRQQVVKANDVSSEPINVKRGCQYTLNFFLRNMEKCKF